MLEVLEQKNILYIKYTHTHTHTRTHAARAKIHCLNLNGQMRESLCLDH